MAYEKAIRIDIPEEQWEETGGDEMPWSRLLVAFNVNGTMHHVEAIAVTTEDRQDAVNESFQSNLDGMYEAGEPDKSFETVTIRGREYVLNMTPYC